MSKQLLILDIDERLVDSAESRLSQSEDFRVGPYWVYKRPHVDDFLRSVAVLAIAVVGIVALARKQHSGLKLGLLILAALWIGAATSSRIVFRVSASALWWFGWVIGGVGYLSSFVDRTVRRGWHTVGHSPGTYRNRMHVNLTKSRESIGPD